MHLKSTVSLLWPLQVAIMGAIATCFFLYKAIYFVHSFGRNLT